MNSTLIVRRLATSRSQRASVGGIGRLPQAHAAVGAAARESRPVGAKREAADAARVRSGDDGEGGGARVVDAVDGEEVDVGADAAQPSQYIEMAMGAGES